MPEKLRIAFIGSGAANFGGGEGPWDHASRLEKIEGLSVVGVADPDIDRAEARLKERNNPIYGNAKAYADYKAMLDEKDPDAVWIGVPPNAHGTTEAGRDMEIVCARAGVHMFIEKPLSSARPEEVLKVADELAVANVIVSVGYMFRYSRAIEQMKRIITETEGGLKAFIARYDCAYSEIAKPEWWDVRMSGGPIVEQATHFVDLARFLVGDADLSTLLGTSITASDAAGSLVDIPSAPDGRPYDSVVPDEFKAPRVTAAVWKFENGAVGSLTHGTLLHGKKYETEIEIWGDGLRMSLLDLYGNCRLMVRRPHSEATEEIELVEDDPYLTEDEVFVEAVRSGDTSRIRSPYEDALKTFELTWAITDAAKARR